MFPVSPAAGDWFRRAFDEFYTHLYAHRDQAEAKVLIHTLRARVELDGPVLDVACGPGRFLRALRSAGITAVGLDLSRPLLRRASKPAEGGPPELICADMRRLPVAPQRFAWALLLFTSFGYFAHEAEDHAVLAEIARVLRPQGRIALDFLNAKKVEAELVPESEREVSGRRVREVRWIDPAGPYLRKRVEVAPPSETGGGIPDARTLPIPALVYEERVRLYSPDQLLQLLRRAGFTVEERFGDYGGASFDGASSPRCLLIGRKEDRS